MYPPLSQLHADLVAGTRTSLALTEQCLARIAEVDDQLRAVLALDRTACAQAEAADERFRTGRQLSLLDGIPVLLKDNIDTAGLTTTCGSRLLAGTPPRQDAVLVSRLRDAGAVILGKTNMTEWANFRSTKSTEGWSGAGGQTRNPYLLGHSPGGSSSGSAVAVAAGMAPLAFGTDTDGSVVAPAGLCGVVGVKPEPGMLPLTGIAAVSEVQDSVGVFAVRVEDAIAALNAITGSLAEPMGIPSANELRVGIWQIPRTPPEVRRAMETAAGALTGAGASIVALELPVDQQLLIDGLLALTSDFRPTVERYLQNRPDAPTSLDELILANCADPVELELFGQELFEQAALIGEQERSEAVELRQRVHTEAVKLIENTMFRYGVDAILAPSNEAAWLIDYELGDPYPLSSSSPSSLARFPNLSIPVGFAGDLPIGMSIFGPALLRDLIPIALCVEDVCVQVRAPSL
jgi:amidase